MNELRLEGRDSINLNSYGPSYVANESISELRYFEQHGKRVRGGDFAASGKPPEARQTSQ